mgnify:CR=1 FL=1
MIDPTSFGTAITVLTVIVVFVIAFGLAILSDMALRRREDRAEHTRSEPEKPEKPAVRAPTDRSAANGRVPS